MKIKELLCMYLLLAVINISVKAQQKVNKATEKRIEGLASFLSISPDKAREIVKAMNLQDAEIKDVFKNRNLNQQQRDEQLRKLYTNRLNRVNDMLTGEQRERMVHLLDPELSIRRLSIELARAEKQQKFLERNQAEKAGSAKKETITGTAKMHRP